MMEILIVALAIQSISILLFCTWFARSRDSQMREIMRGFLSRNAYEFSESKLMEKPKKMPKDPLSDLVPVEDMSDNEFLDMIKEQVNR